MMEHYKAYKHVNNRDVAFYPTRIQKQDNGDRNCSGWWVNVVNPNGHFLINHVTDKVSIKSEDASKWKQIELRWKK